MRTSVLLVLCLAVGCGGVNGRYVLEERADADEVVAAIGRVAMARGLAPRIREGERVTFHGDAGRHTRLTFQRRRNRITLSVRYADEEAPADVIAAELARGRALGEEILAAAHSEHTRFVAERQERERIEAEQRAAREAQERRDAADQAQQQARLQAFMNQHQQRMDQRRAERSRAEPPTTSGNSRAHCCVNGAFYDCPSAAAVDRCSGAFMRCVAGCGGTCFESCMSSNPPDPSACSRDPGRDGEC